MINLDKFDNYDTDAYKFFTNPSVVEKDLRILIGILNGIKSDSVINEIEHSELLNWINARRDYESKKPYSQVIQLLRQALADSILTKDEAENIIWFCNQYVDQSSYFDELTAGIQKLTGILKGISIDSNVNAQELLYLDNWLEENEYLKNTYPYDEIYSLTTQIIKDKVVTKEEQEDFLRFANAITGDHKSNSNSAIVETLKTGFFQIDPDIRIQDSTFCITGVSRKFKRREIAEKIELYGGYIVDNVSSKINYLVVCDEKNSCWAFTCYGRKIEEAIKLRKQGLRLVIVHEFDLYDTFENL
jgi:NAD-dependent DNA ligase